ncbi:MAG TPA: hypothetical protein VGD88_07710 [Opitutaceae bacterium]
MSLINDALKKAQKQRTGETPPLASLPSVGGETPHRIARRAKPAGFDTLIIRAGVGAGVLLVVVVGGYFAFRGAPEDRSQKTENSPTQTASTPAPSSVLRPPSSEPVSAPSAAPAPTFTLPVAPKPEPVAAVQRTEDREPRTAQTAEPSSALRPPSAEPAKPAPVLTGSDPRVSPFRAQTPPPAASDPQVSGLRSQVSEPAKPAPKLEPRAIQFIENIKVAGIMARPTDSKVLMNDRVYRIGSLVEAEMGLTLVGITANSLTFEDGNGGRYTRTF